MKNIGLIDIDSHNFPNLVLMKISAYYKNIGYNVEWYNKDNWYDLVCISKVFTFTNDIDYSNIQSDKIFIGGTGYKLKRTLPEYIEDIYPDYNLYPDLTINKSFGYLTRGCPLNCKFCIVGKKEGYKSIKVSNLDRFWNGQKEIILLDPNITACNEFYDLIWQLIKSNSFVDFTQGISVKFLNQHKIDLLSMVKIKQLHFAWDNYNDKRIIIPKIEMLRDGLNLGRRKLICYVLTNFDTTIDQDIERIMTLKKLNIWPYVMVYNKSNLPRGSFYNKLQRWVNNRMIWETTETFDEYCNKFVKGKIIY